VTREDVFGFSDEMGPAKVIHISEPRVGLRAIVVVDNTAAGPAIGGTRMAADVSLSECVRLARAMTLKNAAAGLPHGGAKSVIFGDPRMPVADKEMKIRAFACAIREFTDYIPGPDMGTDEVAMAWIKSETGRAVGLPPEIGGIPLDEIGATGFGLSVAAEIAKDFLGFALKGSRVAVQGFGAVGRHAARFLTDKGAILVAASDSRGAIVNPNGLDVTKLLGLKSEGKSVTELVGATVLPRDEILRVECDIWIPAARPDVIHEANVDEISARLVLQGANIPVSLEAEKRLHKRGILSVPDFIVNAGGVIAASVEYHGGTRTAAFEAIAEKISANTRSVLEAAKRQKILPRTAALAIAEQRIKRAMSFGRWGSK
jgi:glutamate dehydrogenase (NAD(P)+)